MKYYGIVLFILLSFAGFAQDVSEKSASETTTYYLIRHAEKDRSDTANKNPDLTQEGRDRAVNWSKVFDKVAFDQVYSTNYLRTLRTAAPTAMAQGVEVRPYDPRDLFNKKFQKETLGKTVLVVGHSNTTPAFVNAILDESRFQDMEDSDNGSLFIVTLAGDTKHVQVLTIN